jgi:hypothetical protein
LIRQASFIDKFSDPDKFDRLGDFFTCFDPEDHRVDSVRGLGSETLEFRRRGRSCRNIDDVCVANATIADCIFGFTLNTDIALTLEVKVEYSGGKVLGVVLAEVVELLLACTGVDNVFLWFLLVFVIL